MKTLKLISQSLKQWHKNQETETKIFEKNNLVHQKNNNPHKNEQNGCRFFSFACKVHPPIMAIITVASLTSVISDRFYNQPELAVGTISPVTIEAPKDGSFDDEKTTEELRRKTRTGLLPILQENKTITNSIYLSLSKQLNKVDQIRETRGIFPYLDTEELPVSTQLFLRECSDENWQEIITNLQGQSNPSSFTNSFLQEKNKALQEIKDFLEEKEDRITLSDFLGKINQVRQQYKEAVEAVITAKIGSLNNEQKIKLINLETEEWELTKNAITIALNRILGQGIPPGLPEEIQRKTVLIQLGDSIPKETKPLATNILLSSLETNLEIDEKETKNRAEKAAQSIKPVQVYAKKNSVIVNEGERITQSQFVLLDGFGLSRRGINWTGVGVSGLLVTASVVMVFTIAKRTKRNLRRRDHVLLWLLALSVPAIAIINPIYAPLPVVGLLVSSFYGPTLAITNVTLLTALTLFKTGGGSWEYLVASYASSILASVLASKLHSREELALLGGGVGLTQAGVYLVINLIISATAGTIWYTVLSGSAIYGLLGVAYSVVALGISPYLERFFDLVTPIRLAELSNPNRPLLKRLAIEAPGTFQHTMFVASLAEAAARELHCNVELVRAGTLYHDIGKMHDPQGFIENQMGGPNKHDIINDPFKSAEIIKKHVSEGLVMARQYGLPKAIRDFIPQHQGTLLISYFYFQAKNEAEKNADYDFNEDDFRYDGPIPQTRETGIVMLADGCEAALRSLKDATPEKALAMVHKIFKARWRDNQLDECGIKYEELPIIAEIFVRVWQQFNHQRIAYPKGALDPKKTKSKVIQ